MATIKLQGTWQQEHELIKARDTTGRSQATVAGIDTPVVSAPANEKLNPPPANLSFPKVPA